eukprot:UN14548
MVKYKQPILLLFWFLNRFLNHKKDIQINIFHCNGIIW